MGPIEVEEAEATCIRRSPSQTFDAHLDVFRLEKRCKSFDAQLSANATQLPAAEGSL